MGGPPSTSVRIASFAPAGFFTRSMSTVLSPTTIRSKRPNAARNRESPSSTSSSDAPSVSESDAAATAL